MTFVLFDTCIVLDLMQKREPFFDDAQRLFLAVANRRIKGCLTAKSVLDIYYLLHRANHSGEETKKYLVALLKLFEILDTTAVDCRKAVLSGVSDFEDAVRLYRYEESERFQKCRNKSSGTGRSDCRNIQGNSLEHCKFPSLKFTKSIVPCAFFVLKFCGKRIK